MHRKLENIFYEIREPRLTWEDIGGLAAAKKALLEMVCLPIRKSKEMKAMGLHAHILQTSLSKDTEDELREVLEHA